MRIATWLTASSTTLVGVALLPALMSAQRPDAREWQMQFRNPVAPLIDARRELDLSTRQLVQLDSIERGLLQQNRSVAATMRARTDSLLRGKNPRELTAQERQALREKLQALRPMHDQMVRNDSLARARAFALLDSTQKSRAGTLIRRAARQNLAMRRMRGMDAREMRGAARDHRDMRRLRMRMRMREYRDGDGSSPRFRDFGGGMGRGYRGESGRQSREEFDRIPGRELGRRFRDDLRTESFDSTGRGTWRRFLDDSTRERADSLDRPGARRQRGRVPGPEAPADTLHPPF